MKCTFKKENNEPCNANAMKISKFCYLHNPEIPEEEKLNAQSNGGKGNAIKIFEPVAPIFLDSADDVVNLLADTINKVRSGEMEIKVANCIGYLSGHLTKALEISLIEQRIQAIERVIARK